MSQNLEQAMQSLEQASSAPRDLLDADREPMSDYIPGPKYLLYAELLSNIRQISVTASLTSPATLETSLNLTDDGLSVFLKHNGSTSRLKLPAPVAVNDSKPRTADVGDTEISWRLPLLDQSPIRKDEDFSQAAIAPWAATDLPSRIMIRCKRCTKTLVFPKSGTMTWKDLPSENWAEMMDFWHCHKPTDNDNEHGNVDDKSAVKFAAKSGIGFVGLTYMLVSEKDCINMKINPLVLQDKDRDIICAECNFAIGVEDFQAGGIRLYKWNLWIHDLPMYPLSYYITSYIASLVNSQAVSRFVIRLLPIPHFQLERGKDEHMALLLWVFSPKIIYSTSDGSKSKTPQIAMKIFYKFIEGAAERDKLLDNPAVEEISLPDRTLYELELAMAKNNQQLPESVRKFQDWHVTLLDRYGGDKK